MKIAPQEGPQTMFLASAASVVIYGGGGGGGKTWALLLEALRHVKTPNFAAVIFRRTVPEITAPGGILDASMRLYPHAKGKVSPHYLRWTFPHGATIRFSHMQTAEDRLSWSGSELPLICFDELQTFEAEQFWFLLSRNRSTCGVDPYIRATCNPDPDSFVAKLIEWWIDEATGLPIHERSGVLRWFARDPDGEIEWADTPEALIQRLGPDCAPKSFTFIPARVYDNKVLMEKNPGYVANLKAMSRVDRARLLDGNWKVRPSAGMFFKRQWFEIVDAAPAEGTRVRSWDRAASQGKGDYTAGVKMLRDQRGVYWVEDVVRFQGSPQQVESAIVNTASRDGHAVSVNLETDPGQAGVAEVGYLTRALAGFNVKSIRPTGDKETRSKPVSSQSEAGNVKIVRGPWNDAFLTELENFPMGKNDDQVDGFSGAFNSLAQRMTVMFAV